MKKNKDKKGKRSGFIADALTLKKSVREYKKPSFLAPVFVMAEVVLEVLIPYVMTLLLAKIKLAGEAGDAK